MLEKSTRAIAEEIFEFFDESNIPISASLFYNKVYQKLSSLKILLTLIIFLAVIPLVYILVASAIYFNVPVSYEPLLWNSPLTMSVFIMQIIGFKHPLINTVSLKIVPIIRIWNRFIIMICIEVSVIHFIKCFVYGLQYY